MNSTMVAFNLVYIGACLIGLAIFAWIFLSTRKSERSKPMSVSRWKRRENVWFWVVVVGLTAALAATIFQTPWNASAEPNRQVVKVMAQQFGFTWSTKTVQADRQVEFQLSSKDVNHAFGIFDPDGVLVGQAQMMPKWPTDYRLTLHKRGTYSIRCFEYCGIGHHTMLDTFVVR
jgi:cytochrome c oxidase subunit II